MDHTYGRGTLYFLSNFDFIFPKKMSTVYCFKPMDHNKENYDDEQVVEVIKNALSKVLVPYYPLAGRLSIDSNGKPVVVCTGEGAVFVEAKASCTIEEIGDDTVLMGELLRDSSAVESILDVPPLCAQVTKFKNGGFVLGICMNHMILDGIAASEFFNAWGEIARGLPLKAPPFLDRRILSARNPPKVEYPHHEFSEVEDISNLDARYKEEIIHKSFCLDHEMIEKLKMVAMEDGTLVKCTTFEVISSFIWKNRTHALKPHGDQKTKFLLVVDARSRFDPPLPKNYCAELMTKPLSYAVKLVREAIQMVTDDYMKSAIDYLEVEKPSTFLAPTTLVLTKWTRLSLDTVDFGWGQPFLIGPAFLPPKELAFLLSHSKDKKSFNTVLLSLPASSMKIFEELMHI
ncbi:hypothetical protein Vadar_028034 [Vaccinium darrowii]|uniref:Uncharacterized protein n=1 Tax=Vaccinium darrowii TaxID=229202 RepID=A0ACB7X4X0_9ERIC|nr:hypothetical protein Vadar_028034 [Vaccinium darrowii]